MRRASTFDDRELKRRVAVKVKLNKIRGSKASVRSDALEVEVTQLSKSCIPDTVSATVASDAIRWTGTSTLNVSDPNP